MRRIIILASFGTFLLSCNQANDKPADTKVSAETTTPAISYPYKAMYSSDIKMGDPNHAKLVLDFFKKWEDNKLDEMRPMLSDSVRVEFSDGSVFNITADSLMKLARTVRSGLSSLKIEVDSWMPIHVNDKNEDWVLVWEKESTVDAKGKADSSRIHSYWQVKNNKISYWSEFNQKLTPPKMEMPKPKK